jgi:hypothetical protein
VPGPRARRARPHGAWSNREAATIFCMARSTGSARLVPASGSFGPDLRLVFAALAGALAVASGTACTDASRTDAPGNVVVDDTRDQHRPPANPDPPSLDASVADASPAYPADAPDGYAPLSACADCACSPTGHYCFGGGSPRGALASSAPAGDAALPACTPADPGGTQPGCYAVPAACTASPTCECILTALQPRLACYLVCEPGDPVRVYCPTP